MPPGLRRLMRQELIWILAAKFAALGLLWLLFFSPAHRQRVDGEATSRRLAVSNTSGVMVSPSQNREAGSD